MTDITELFDSIWEQQRSIDLAESEFRHLLVDDEELRRTYRSWCSEQGESERRGFINYCRLLLEEEESRYDALAPDEEDY